MERLVLGVDGGNTKTEALIVDTSGNCHGYGRSGCSDIYGAPSSEAALEELDRALAGALNTAGIGAEDLDAATFSLAGADWPEDFDYLRDKLAERAFVRNVSIYNDAFAPLRAGSDNFTGASVVCGTGAAVGARAPGGKEWHASWWLDVHGARQLGDRALRAVTGAELGIEPATGMTAGLLNEYQAVSVAEMLHTLKDRVAGCRRPEIAARVLVEQAEAGDAVALGIAVEHGSRLGDFALVAARQVCLPARYRLVLAGPVLQNSTIITAALTRRVRDTSPDVEIVMPGLRPAFGAVLLSLDRAGVPASMDIRARLLEGQSGE
jgi:N-acetylglucosamine kinase-like BadF-type ATPase